MNVISVLLLAVLATPSQGSEVAGSRKPEAVRLPYPRQTKKLPRQRRCTENAAESTDYLTKPPKASGDGSDETKYKQADFSEC